MQSHCFSTFETQSFLTSKLTKSLSLELLTLAVLSLWCPRDSRQWLWREAQKGFGLDSPGRGPCSALTSFKCKLLLKSLVLSLVTREMFSLPGTQEPLHLRTPAAFCREGGSSRPVAPLFFPALDPVLKAWLVTFAHLR